MSNPPQYVRRIACTVGGVHMRNKRMRATSAVTCMRALRVCQDPACHPRRQYRIVSIVQIKAELPRPESSNLHRSAGACVRACARVTSAWMLRPKVSAELSGMYTVERSDRNGRRRNRWRRSVNEYEREKYTDHSLHRPTVYGNVPRNAVPV